MRRSVNAVTLTDAPPVCLYGDLDIATTARLLARDDLGRPGETVVVDMSEVTFIDAAALGAIVHLRNDVIAAGGTFALTSVPARVARIFTVCGLAPLL